MARADGDAQRAFREDLNVESRLTVIGRGWGKHAGEQRDLEGSGAQSPDENGACAFTQRDHDRRSFACEAAERVGDHTRGGARKRSEPNRRDLDRVCAIELALGRLHRLKGRGRVAEEHVAGGSQPDSLALADHERVPGRPFERCNPLGDR
jgi:hypothetical protein